VSETKVSRRGRGEDAIYFATAKNRYVGSVSLGYGPDGKRIRRKVFSRTKQEVREKLKALHQELNAGVRSSSTYTVRDAVDDWLREGLDGTSERTRTLYEGLLGPVLEVIGARPLRVLTAGDVRLAFGQLVARYSTRSLQITRNSLERVIRHAEANDLVGRNVAGPGEAATGPQWKAVQELHAEAGEGLAGHGGEYTLACVRRAEPAGWHSHRGGPCAAVGPRGELGGRFRRMAAGHHGWVRLR